MNDNAFLKMEVSSLEHPEIKILEFYTHITTVVTYGYNIIYYIRPIVNQFVIK